MAKFVTIGGGNLREGDTLAIDRRIAALAGRERPRVLFIPTASHDAGGYVNAVCRVYRHLGCSFSTLLYFIDPAAAEHAAEKVEKADIIYVGGGNTQLLLETWRRFGLDRLLRQAADGGKLLCGLSAGAICWFAGGYSDFDPGSGAQPIFRGIEGLGLLPGLCCPHYDEPGRGGFDSFLAGRSGVALANNCALLVDGDRCEAMGEGVYLFSGGQKRRLADGEQFPLAALEAVPAQAAKRSVSV